MQLTLTLGSWLAPWCRCFWTVQNLGGKIASTDHDWFAVVCCRIRLWIVILFGHPLLPGPPCNMFHFHSIWVMLWGYFPPQQSGVQTSHSATVTVLPSFKPLGMENHFITTIFGQIEWGGPVADENISLISASKKNKVQLSIVPPKNILRKPFSQSHVTWVPYAWWKNDWWNRGPQICNPGIEVPLCGDGLEATPCMSWINERWEAVTGMKYVWQQKGLKNAAKIIDTNLKSCKMIVLQGETWFNIFRIQA